MKLLGNPLIVKTKTKEEFLTKLHSIPDIQKPTNSLFRDLDCYYVLNKRQFSVNLIVYQAFKLRRKTSKHKNGQRESHWIFKVYTIDLELAKKVFRYLQQRDRHFEYGLKSQNERYSDYFS